MTDFNQEIYLKHLKLVKNHWYNLKYVPIKYQKQDLCIAAIKQSPGAMSFVKRQTNELCLAAVKIQAYSIQYVKNQTEEICFAAIGSNAYALQYVKKQFPELCANAIKADSRAILHVKDLFSVSNLVSDQFIQECIDWHSNSEIGIEYKKIKKIKEHNAITNNLLESVSVHELEKRKVRASL